jgi:hypothetical protein
MLRTPERILPKIEECEDENPNEVDEMPVQAGDFHDLVVAASFFIEATFDPGRDYEQINYTGAYMKPVKPRDHKKG